MFTELGRIIEQCKSTVENNSIERAAPCTGTENVPEILVSVIPEVVVSQFLDRLEGQIRLTERQVLETIGRKT